MTSSIRFVAIPELQNEIEKPEKFSDRRNRALYMRRQGLMGRTSYDNISSEKVYTKLTYKYNSWQKCSAAPAVGHSYLPRELRT
jgi:hypothetical protein